MITDRDPRRPRVVSLVPSATETLLALGADVVACTRFCNQPIHTVGGTKNPDVGAIVELAPDVVVVDTEENRLEDAEALRAGGLHVVVTSVRSVDDAFDVVDQLAAASGRPAPNLPRATSAVGARRSAFVPIWRRPWMSINGTTYGASLLRSIGVDLVTADLPTEYPSVELEVIAALDPELVLVPSEPYSFTAAHLAEISAALPDTLVVTVDGEDLFWWGIRTPAARDRLAHRLATA